MTAIKAFTLWLSAPRPKPYQPILEVTFERRDRDAWADWAASLHRGSLWWRDGSLVFLANDRKSEPARLTFMVCIIGLADADLDAADKRELLTARVVYRALKFEMPAAPSS